jgi:ABC-type nickel/cobalt efflux system permease component RcnA
MTIPFLAPERTFDMFTAALAGVLAGFVHVLSGPDHLAAIAPIASDQRRLPWTTGALWGLGHSSGVLVVGLSALWLRDWLPLDAVSSWSERAVGVVLIGIGLWGLHRALRRHVHTHPHSHGPVRHEHAHVHATPQTDGATPGPVSHAHTHAAFLVGVLHGLAGSSHLIGVLPALALPGLLASIGYLGGYGAGTVVGMTLVAGAIGGVAARARARHLDAPRWLLSATSTLALLVGAAWLVL